MWFFSRKREIRYILSIDGGGMRGIIPSVVLARLNSILRSMGDRRPLYSHFDMIAGTSTGALLALGLASPAEKTALTAENLQPFAVESVRKTGRKFLYETTVGAGLPVICTLKDLRETGDRVISVEGLVSGTLCWLFSEYDGSIPFSELVKKARSLGYTEPDPRDDLSGMDVARKTVILARELGYTTETSDIDVESLVPEEMRELSIDEFLERLSDMDEKMLDMYKEAEKKGMKLRYVGKVEGGVCSVALKEYPLDHPFSQAKGTDNVISFRTARYDKQPLVIKGPGAGPEVTAGGVFADILRLSAYLGSKV